jgi:hypothetical protein
MTKSDHAIVLKNRFGGVPEAETPHDHIETLFRQLGQSQTCKCSL